jgi:hypothetical protein
MEIAMGLTRIQTEKVTALVQHAGSHLLEAHVPLLRTSSLLASFTLCGRSITNRTVGPDQNPHRSLNAFRKGSCKHCD